MYRHHEQSAHCPSVGERPLMCDQAMTELLQRHLDIVIKISNIKVANLEARKDDLRLHHERTLPRNKDGVSSAKLDLEQASLDAAAASRLKDIARLKLELAKIEQQLDKYLHDFATKKSPSSAGSPDGLIEQLFGGEGDYDLHTMGVDDFGNFGKMFSSPDAPVFDLASFLLANRSRSSESGI